MSSCSDHIGEGFKGDVMSVELRTPGQSRVKRNINGIYSDVYENGTHVGITNDITHEMFRDDGVQDKRPSLTYPLPDWF